MQPRKILTNWIQQNANSAHYLFTLQDLRSLCFNLSEKAFTTLMSRSVSAGYLVRVCRSLYCYKKAIPPNGLLLFHVAAHLRAHEFNYMSLETILSEVGVISQVSINWITIMSSGRSNIVSCGEFGTIEFIHTNQKPNDLLKHLSYDSNCRLWRADVSLAVRDMKITRRNCDLINWDIANELI